MMVLSKMEAESVFIILREIMTVFIMQVNIHKMVMIVFI